MSYSFDLQVVEGVVQVKSVEGDHETFLQGQSAQEIADILCL